MTMKDDHLNELFAKARMEPSQVPVEEVGKWVSTAVVATGFAALLPKLKLLIAKKSLIMLSVSTGIIAVGVTSMSLMSANKSLSVVVPENNQPDNKNVAMDTSQEPEDNNTRNTEVLNFAPVQEIPLLNKKDAEQDSFTNEEPLKAELESNIEEPQSNEDIITELVEDLLEDESIGQDTVVQEVEDLEEAELASEEGSENEPENGVYSKDVSIKNFNELSIGGVIDVVIVQGDQPALKILAEYEKDLEAVKIQESNGHLKISGNNEPVKEQSNISIGRGRRRQMRVNDCSCSHRGDLVVYLTVTNLNKLTANGVGDVEGKGRLKMDNFSVNVSGVGDVELAVNCTKAEVDVTAAGDVELDIDCEELAVRCYGAGDIELEGETNKANFNVGGAGDLDADKMSINELFVVTNGAGDVNVFVKDKIHATANGVGDISYSGSPGNVEIIENGIGEVRHY